ncbi:MAG: hypothetical protein R2764_23830 [Bacteroidales bacterium]
MHEKDLVQIAQVHSHPGDFIGHSWGMIFGVHLSLKDFFPFVVGNYSQKEKIKLEECGVHRFNSDRFRRLSNGYIKDHFMITSNTEVKYIDLRNE